MDEAVSKRKKCTYRKLSDSEIKNPLITDTTRMIQKRHDQT